MSSQMASVWSSRSVVALLLAIIGLHAVVPAAAPLERVHGSAFGATTFEVAVAPGEEHAKQDRREILQHFDLPTGPVPDGPWLTIAGEAQARAEQPDSTGPPAFEILKRQPSPRAPPAI